MARDEYRLTERESQVLHGMAAGLTLDQIARRLQISRHTAKARTGSLFQRLGARDRANAVAIGYETGLLRPGTVPVPASARLLGTDQNAGGSQGRPVSPYCRCCADNAEAKDEENTDAV